jgi:hypothetical protein
MIKDVQKELHKSNGDTNARSFTFDRNTDIGSIQLGDRFHTCVSSNDLNPPEGTECEKNWKNFTMRIHCLQDNNLEFYITK